MKTAAALSIVTALLGVYAIGAETKQASPPSPPAAEAASAKGAAALRGAADAKQYLFAFFYEKDDEATRTARKTFDAAAGKITPAVRCVAVDRTATGEKVIVEKFALGQAPMPLVLAIAPNGAVTGGIKPADLSEQGLRDAMVSPGLQQCLKALQERKLVLICLQNAQTKANDAAMKGVKEFTADPQFADSTEIVKVDPSDAKEAKLMAQLQADPKAKTASTALLAPPGMVVTKVDGGTSKAGLEAALKKAMASCGPGAGSGCCPAPK